MGWNEIETHSFGVCTCTVRLCLFLRVCLSGRVVCANITKCMVIRWSFPIDRRLVRSASFRFCAAFAESRSCTLNLIKARRIMPAPHCIEIDVIAMRRKRQKSSENSEMKNKQEK